MRRVFLLLVAALIITALIWIGYLFWRRLAAAPAGDTKRIPQQLQRRHPSPQTGNDHPTLVISQPAARYWITGGGSELLIVTYSGTIVAAGAAGKATTVDERAPKTIASFRASPDGSRALINFTVFDAAARQWTTLPEGTTAAVWHPRDANTIAYLKNDGIYLFNLTKGTSSLLTKLNNRDWLIDWPAPETIYLTSKPTSAAAGSVWRYDLKSKILTPLVTDEPAPAIIWSAAGWGLKLNTASLIDLNGGELINLSAVTPGQSFITLPGKCAAAAPGLYCAVPQDLPPETVLPDDYLKRKLYTSDRIYFVGVDREGKTAQARLLLPENDDAPIDAVQLSAIENTLFFINRYDQKLYRLEIKNGD